MEKISTILDSAHGLLSDPHGPDALSWRDVDIDGRKIIVPSFWSDTAARILATKYMRKDGVPMQLERNPISLDHIRLRRSSWRILLA